MATKKMNSTATLQQKLGFIDSDLRKPKHDEIMLWADENADAIVQSVFPETEQAFQSHFVKITKKRWEHAVVSRNGFIVGFIDLLIEIKCCDESHSTYKAHLNGRCVLPRPESQGTSRIALEIKSILPTRGEIIRQVRMYQTYERAAYVIVTPNPSPSVVKLLEEQGIKTVDSNRRA
ncbi:MAG: hypothetical protein H0X34_17610 [Chthoniobacterales bacterium]|nr:hypothetical protein [Chthoniobacterales bacterium]